MKKTFSKHWTGSKQPRKQRKYRANAPLHIRHKLMSVNLSKELRKKYGKRNFPLKRDDKVKIMKGEFKGKIGKIDILNMQKLKTSIAEISRTKKDGTKIKVWFDPSNLQIQELNLEDRKRVSSLERKAKEKTEKKVEIKKTKIKSKDKK